MGDFKQQIQYHLMTFDTTPAVFQSIDQAYSSINTNKSCQLLKELIDDKKMLQQKSEHKENIPPS